MSWEMKRIGEVCDVIPGFAFKSKDLGEIGIPVVKIGNITDDYKVDTNSVQCLPENLITEKHEKFLLTNHDILIAMTGATAGKVGRIRCSEEQVLLLNQRVAKFKPRDINPDFFWSAISTPRYRTIFYRLGGGAAQPNMSGAQIEAVEIPYPPPNVQDRIASILSTYDDLIENNQRRIQLLEQSAQLLYKEWFVHLRFPGHEHVTITDGVPEGWKEKHLSELVTTQYGFTETATDEPIGPKFLRGTDINKTSYIDWSTVPHCPEDKLDFNKYALRVGDIVVIRMADPGKVAIVETEQTAVFASYLVRLTRKTGVNIPTLYLFYALSDDAYQGFIRGASGGATRKSASAKLLVSFNILIPSSTLVGLFVEQVWPLKKQIQQLLQQNASLRQARDLLLPRLMNGEVTV